MSASSSDSGTSSRYDTAGSFDEQGKAPPNLAAVAFHHMQSAFDECWLNHQCPGTPKEGCELCVAAAAYNIAVPKLLERLKRQATVDATMASTVARFEQDSHEEHQEEVVGMDETTSLKRDHRCVIRGNEHSLTDVIQQGFSKPDSHTDEISSFKRQRMEGSDYAMAAPNVKFAAATKPKWVGEVLGIFATYDPSPLLTTTTTLQHESHHAAGDVVAKLGKFQAFLDKGFVNKTVGADKDRYFETVASVMMWKDDDDDDGFMESTEGRKPEGRCGDLKKEPSNDDGFYLLPLKAYENETKVSHKMLYAIMFRAACILNVEHMIMAHEPCQEMDAFVQGSKDDQENYVEYMIRHVCQHLRMQRVVTVDIPSSKISQSRTSSSSSLSSSNNKVVKSYERLHHNGILKAIGRLSRKLMHAFGFGGIGKDCTVRGAVVSLISIEVLEMELRHAGTSQSQILVRSSGNYPLFSKAATLAIMGNQSSPSDYDRMFPETNDPTLGLYLLAGLMLPKPTLAFSIGEAFYCDRLDSQAGVALKNHLGSGAFCNVYELTDGGVIKVPKEPRLIKDLEDEMNILKSLNDDCIPKAEAENLGFLKVHIKCEVSGVKCLRLTGVVGESTTNFVFKSFAQLAWVCCEVGKALDHAHGVGIAHLDVHPSNIVVSVGEPNNPKVQLIDWGLAEPFQKRLSGFRGSPPYAHEILLVRDKTTVVDTKEDDCWMETEMLVTSNMEREVVQEEVKPCDELESDHMKEEETATTIVETDLSTKDKIMTRDGRWFPSPKYDFASLAYTVTTIMYRMKTKSSSCPWDDFVHDEMELAELEPRRSMVKTHLTALDGDLGVYLRKMCCGAGIQYPISATDLPTIV